MSELNPKVIVEDILDIARGLLRDHGEVAAHFVFANLGKPLTIANVDSLMRDENTKNVASWVPVYYGLLNNGIDLVAIVTESWTLNSSNIEEYYDKERATNPDFLQSLIQQYGSISQMPNGFKQEVISLHVEVSGQTHHFIWPIKRNDQGVPSISDDIVIDMDNSQQKVGGRFANFIARYHALDGKIKEVQELKQQMNHPEIRNKELDLTFFAELNDRIDDSNHHQVALALAKSVFETEKETGNDQPFHFSAPKNQQ